MFYKVSHKSKYNKGTTFQRLNKKMVEKYIREYYYNDFDFIKYEHKGTDILVFLENKIIDKFNKSELHWEIRKELKL